MTAAGGRPICLGVIVAAHGVRGLVKIKSFTETPEDLTAYGPLHDEGGRRRFGIALTGRAKDLLLARVAGVGDRDAAEALKGTRLYVERAALPEPEPETYYHADLVGLPVEDEAGEPLGRVAAVQNFGAGDLIEVEGPDGTTQALPFTRAAVPLVDIAGGRLVVRWPEEVGPEEVGPEQAAADAAATKEGEAG